MQTRFPKAMQCGYGLSDVRIPAKKPLITELSLYHEEWRPGSARFCSIAYVDGHAAVVMMRGNADRPSTWIGRDGTHPSLNAVMK